MTLLLALALGVLIGNFFPLKQNNISSAEDSKYQELKAKFDNLSSIDFEEYVQLKNQKEKYEKADEIFGKILTIFLYDLGIRSSKTQLETLKQTVVNDSPQTVAVARAEKTSIATPLESAISPPKNRDWINRGSKAKELYSEADVKDFLDSIEIKDLFSELKGAGSISSTQLSVLNGNYTGEIVFDDQTKSNWRVEMNLNGQIVNGILTGRNHIILSKDGKVFSHSRGKGDLKNFQSFDGDENAFLISIYNDDGFMQLYNIERMNMLSGLVYLKSGVGQYSRAGTVTLK